MLIEHIGDSKCRPQHESSTARRNTIRAEARSLLAATSCYVDMCRMRTDTPAVRTPHKPSTTGRWRKFPSLMRAKALSSDLSVLTVRRSGVIASATRIKSRSPPVAGTRRRMSSSENIPLSRTPDHKVAARRRRFHPHRRVTVTGAGAFHILPSLNVSFQFRMLGAKSYQLLSSSSIEWKGLCRKFRSDQHFVGNGFGYKADGE